jgi:hypothetical protein
MVVGALSGCLGCCLNVRFKGTEMINVDGNNNFSIHCPHAFLLMRLMTEISTVFLVLLLVVK